MPENTALWIKLCHSQSTSPCIQGRVSNGTIYIRNRHIRHRYFRAQQPQKHLMLYVFRRRGIRQETTRLCHQRRPVPVIEPPHVLGAQCFPAQSCRPFCAATIRPDSHPKLSMTLQFGGCFCWSTRCTLFPMKTSKPAKLGPQTQAIHGGEPNRRGVNGPIVTEIIRSSTFTFSSTEEMKLWAEGKSDAYIYTRYGNPTLSIAEKKIAALEGAEAAVVTASGMAAIPHSLLAVLHSGDELISSAQLYGGTYRLMRDVFPNLGIKVHHVEANLEGIETLITPRTKCLYVESPTNPSLRLVDIRKAVAFAKKHKLVSIIDNTFATPLLQNPIALGYDIVVHSATKALAGHSDLIAGVAAGSAEWIKKVR